MLEGKLPVAVLLHPPQQRFEARAICARSLVHDVLGRRLARGASRPAWRHRSDLNGGFGVWEFAFLAAVTYSAFRGLQSYELIGVGWLLHTGWDVLRHLYGNPIVPFAADSSFGCAV